MALIFAFGNPVYDDITNPSVSTNGRILSGCSTNGCLALARLGHQSVLVGRIGADYYDRFRADLRRYGVADETKLCKETGGFRLIYDAHGNRTLDILGVAEALDYIPSACIGAAAIIVGPIMQETPLAIVERIQQISAAPLFLDPQGLLRRIRADGRIDHYLPGDFADIVRRCHVVKANELETHVITGINPRNNPAEAARRIRAFGCDIAIVTLAEAGSYIATEQQEVAIPAFPTDVRDPTGAGDTYMAGFMHAYLANPADLYQAGCVGAATASIWIEASGPETPIDQAEVTRRTHALLSGHLPPARFT